MIFQQSLSKMSKTCVRIIIASLLIAATFSVTSFVKPTRHKFRKLYCSVSNKTIEPGIKCYVKNWSRTFSTVNAIFNVMSPIYESTVSLNYENFAIRIWTSNNFCSRKFIWSIATQLRFSSTLWLTQLTIIAQFLMEHWIIHLLSFC